MYTPPQLRPDGLDTAARGRGNLMREQAGRRQGKAPPQYSRDGRWWWDGLQWTPVQQGAAQAQPLSRWDGQRWISLDERFWWDGTAWQPLNALDAVGLPPRVLGGAGQKWYRRFWPTSPRGRHRIVVGSQVRGADARTYRVHGARIVGRRRRYYAYGSDGDYYWLPDSVIYSSGGDLCIQAEPERAGPPDADGKPSDCARSEWVSGPGEYLNEAGAANWASDATVGGANSSLDFSPSDSGGTWSDAGGSGGTLSDSGGSFDSGSSSSGGGGSSDSPG